MSKKKTVFIYPIWGMNATFIKRDLTLLKKHFEIVPLDYDEKDRLFFFRLLKHLWGKDLCFIWFGGKHAFWAWLACKLLRKKLIIVAGGYDAIYMPELQYGLKYENKAWRRTYFAFKHADTVLAVSNSIAQSLLHNCGNMKNIEVVYHGFTDPGCLINTKENIVTTICHVRWANVKRKGLETLVKVARHLPEVPFYIVGKHLDDSVDYLRSMATPNVKFCGYLAVEEMEQLLMKSKVYAQLSFHEGFGCALAEAMLYGCVPVVTQAGAIPEVVGEEAFYVKYGDVEGSAKVFREALKSSSGEKFKKRVMDLFPISKREKALKKICQN